MIDLSNLSPPKGATRPRKRVGRGPGSGLGKTAGRGQKGQKSRSGGSVPPGFEGGQMPLSRRLPKRGFRNKFRTRVAIVNLDKLTSFEAGATVDEASLKEAGLVGGRYDVIKVLGEGDLDRALTVKVHRVSAGAKQKIEQAGGKVEVVGGQ